MKKLIGCLLAVISVSGVARAAPIVVMEAAVDESQRLTAKFDYDSKLGRAWVAVEEAEYRGQVSRSTVMKNVDGLSYDSEAKEVLYQRGDSPIVCAEVKTVLGISTVRATGNCPLVVSYEQRTVDDGFHQSTQTFAKVTLNPQMPPAQTSKK